MSGNYNLYEWTQDDEQQREAEREAWDEAQSGESK